MTKLDFIKNIPNIEKIDPYTNIAFVKNTKQLLYENGFYKVTPNNICDTTIINLVLVAQGKKKMHLKLSKKRRESDKKKIFID